MCSKGFILPRAGKEVCILDLKISQGNKVREKEGFKISDDISSKQGSKPSVNPFRASFAVKEAIARGRALSSSLLLVRLSSLFMVTYLQRPSSPNVPGSLSVSKVQVCGELGQTKEHTVLFFVDAIRVDSLLKAND